MRRILQMNSYKNNLRMHQAVRQLARDKPVTVTVKGECMAPWIESEARVDITPARFYWPGDVVVALSKDSRYLVHRVIGGYLRSGKLKLLIQADSAFRPDAAILPGDILGKVTGGLCHRHAVSVPLSHRLKALLRFVRFSAASIVAGRRKKSGYRASQR